MDSGGAMLSKAVQAVSEDACLLQGSWLGIADGVGGWRALGVHSGDFARELMENCRKILATAEYHPKDVITKAMASATQLGSSTVILGCYSRDLKRFVAANLGDSGFLVIRDWQVIESSKPMQSTFGSPMQVGHLTQQVEAADEQLEFDDPSAADCYEVEVKEGDILVMASDGLYDYLFQKEILRTLRKSISLGKNAQAASQQLVIKARSRMQEATPYISACKEHSNRVDDLTVLVARILAPGDQQESSGMVEQLKQFKMKASATALVDEDTERSHGGTSVMPGIGRDTNELDGSETGFLHGAKTFPTRAGHRHDAFYAGKSWMVIASEVCQYGDKLGTLCGKFASDLVARCTKLQKLTAREVLKTAVAKTKCKVKISSTLLVASLVASPQGTGSKLRIANLGDSRVLVVRNWEVVTSTKGMSHGSEKNALDNPFAVGNDSLDEAQACELDLVKNDIVVCGSGGLFSSLFEAGIVKSLRKSLCTRACSLEEAAQILAEKARARMLEPSPCALALACNSQECCLQHRDITAIVAIVQT